MEKKIKILRIDNGTFCRIAGIKRETTTVYAPEQITLLEERRPSWLRDIWLQRGKFWEKREAI